jgi:hypothetical protein
LGRRLAAGRAHDVHHRSRQRTVDSTRRARAGYRELRRVPFDGAELLVLERSRPVRA